MKGLMITDGLRLFSSVKFRKWLFRMYVGKFKFIFPIFSSNSVLKLQGKMHKEW